MPRRTTKTVKRKESLVVDEDLLKEIPVLLRDYEGQLLDTLRQIEESSSSSLRAMQTQLLLNLNKLPKASRIIPLESYAPKEADEVVSLHDQTIDLMERATAIKSTAKSASTRKRKLESAQKAAAGSTLRRSNRARLGKEEETPLRTTRTQQHLSLVTPAGTGPIAFGRTPFITPKFNTMTPLTRTLHRLAKPNETLVSLDGSPVMATVAKTGRGKKKQAEAEFAQIPLGRNLTLNLPIGQDFEHEGLELDEEQLDKLALIQQGISNMLKGRTASSSSTE